MKCDLDTVRYNNLNSDSPSCMFCNKSIILYSLIFDFGKKKKVSLCLLNTISLKTKILYQHA